MSFEKTLILGLIAGSTILLGLPIARLSKPAPVLRQILNAIAVGVLVFLVWDVLSAAWEPVDEALGADGGADWAPAIRYGLLLFVGLTVGLLALVQYERTMPAALDPTKLSLLIAVGIGLHNFAEGLAIGQSAAAPDGLQLAVLLVVGFGLHNATEGFGITAPLAGGDKPSWGRLLLLGAIGGGPTFVGTLLGYKFTSEPLAVVFLSLAAGSILYVVIQLIGVAARARRTDLLAVGMVVGLIAGFVTDAVVTAGGV